MTAQMDGHIRIDDRGVPYVGDTRLKLIHLVMSYQGEDGEGSVDQAREAYDWLPESDLYGALAYYLDHRDEVDRMIAEYHEFSAKMRAEAGESPLARLARERRGA